MSWFELKKSFPRLSAFSCHWIRVSDNFSNRILLVYMENRQSRLSLILKVGEFAPKALQYGNIKAICLSINGWGLKT